MNGPGGRGPFAGPDDSYTGDFKSDSSLFAGVDRPAPPPFRSGWERYHPPFGFDGANYASISLSQYPRRHSPPPSQPSSLAFDVLEGSAAWAMVPEPVRSHDDRLARSTSRAADRRASGHSAMLGLDGADDPRSSQQIQNPTTRPGLTSAMAYPTPTAAKAAERAQSKSTGASSEKPSDLNHLKAKVIASMSRSRAENSSTPTKETNAAYTGTNWPQGERTAPKQPLATERKGSQTDVDGLLAEGKALAAAGGQTDHDSRINHTPRQTDAGNQPNAQDGPANGQKPTGNAEKGRSNGPTPLHDVRPGTAISPDSSATSEQGEIREDPKPTPRTTTTKQTREAQAPGARANATSAESGSSLRRQPNESARYPTLRHVDVDRLAENAAEPRESRPSRPRPESVAAASQNARENTESQLSTERTPRPAEGRPPALGRSRVLNADEAVIFDDKARYRPLAGPDRDLAARRERAPSRAIETIRTDDHRRELDSRTIIEYDAPRYMDEQRLVIGNGNMTLSAGADLEEWLEMTGFNDPVYRREALQRHREMLALEVKRAELAREAHIAQEERAYLARAHSVMPREEAELGYRRSSVVSGTVRSSSGYSMAPPPIPSRGGRDPGTVLVAASGRERSPEIRHPVDRASESRFVLSPPPSMSGSGLAKRRYPHDDELPEVVYAEKLVRVDSRGLSARRRDGDADYPAFRAYSGNDVGPQREVEFVRGRRAPEEMHGPVEVEYDDRHRETPFHGRATPSASLSDRIRVRSLSPLPRRATAGRDAKSDARDHESGTPHSRNAMPLKSRISYSRETSPAHKHEPTEADRPSPPTYRARDDYKDNYVQRRASDEAFRGGYQNRAEYENHRAPPSWRGRGRGAPTNQRGGARAGDRGPNSARQDPAGSPLDFTKDTRFFIVKSFNSDNVIQAQEDGVWATQEKNEGIFSEAFHCSGNVILIFSINKSMQFQGYARMESAPGTAETPPWAKGLLWKSSGPFNIRWIKIANTHFSRVGHLKNPFNEYQAVLVARDGQEVEPQCGLALCELINEEADRTRVR